MRKTSSRPKCNIVRKCIFLPFLSTSQKFIIYAWKEVYFHHIDLYVEKNDNLTYLLQHMNSYLTLSICCISLFTLDVLVIIASHNLYIYFHIWEYKAKRCIFLIR